MMIDTLADVMPYYYIGRQWTLVRFRRKYLLTCDTPVSLLPHPSAHPNAGLGLATAAAIILPVSRDTGLIMDESTNLIDEKAVPSLQPGDSTAASRAPRTSPQCSTKHRSLTPDRRSITTRTISTWCRPTFTNHASSRS
jgi:hypothetical protein